MTETTDPTLQAAKMAIGAGQREEARSLLQRYSRQHPTDYRPWLWLAGLADSPAQSLAYLHRAELLEPDNPAIQKATQWAEQKLAAEQAQALADMPADAPAGDTVAQTAVAQPREQRSRSPFPASPPQRTRPVSAAATTTGTAGETAETRRQRSWLVPAAGFIILAFICGVVAALLSRGVLPLPVLAAETEVTVPAGSPPVKVVADVSDAQATQDAILPLQSPTPTNTSTPLPTPTLQPTFTPEPTATPVPTVVVFPGGSDVPQVVSVAEGERWIDVNLSTQSLTAYEGATPVFDTLISSGLANHPTVTGQYRIWLRYESQTMNGRLLGYDYYLEDVPYVMYFYNDYALHGTYWHNNFGTPMSHGCVNLATPDAEWLFYWSSYGTLVNVHY